MSYRKQDLGKIILLSVLIVAAVGFSLYTVRGARHTPRAPAPAAGPAATTASAAAQSKTAELFAARSNATAGLVARAQETNDPFRPSVSARTRPGVPTIKPRTPVSNVPPFTVQAAVARREDPGFRLFGLVTGPAPVAGIEYAQHRYFARAGEALPDGWRVTRIANSRVTLAKGRMQVMLRMAPAEDRELRPLGVR